MGDIARVSAHLRNFVLRNGPDGRPLEASNDSGLLALEFENGAHGIVQVSAVAHTGGPVVQQEINLHGESGTLEAELPLPTSFGAQLRGARQDEQTLRRLEVPEHLLDEALRGNPLAVFQTQSVGDRLFVDAILENRPVQPDFHAGWKVQAVIDAALESDRTGCWVSVSPDEPR